MRQELQIAQDYLVANFGHCDSITYLQLLCIQNFGKMENRLAHIEQFSYLLLLPEKKIKF